VQRSEILQDSRSIIRTGFSPFGGDILGPARARPKRKTGLVFRPLESHLTANIESQRYMLMTTRQEHVWHAAALPQGRWHAAALPQGRPHIGSNMLHFQYFFNFKAL